MAGRFPRWVYATGTEPDARFSLANERTFLAWVRTGLAFLAAGVALEALEVPVQPGFRLAAAIIFVALGLLAAVQAWVGWMRMERALRSARPLPGPSVGLVIVIGILVAVILIAIGFLV